MKLTKSICYFYYMKIQLEVHYTTQPKTIKLIQSLKISGMLFKNFNYLFFLSFIFMRYLLAWLFYLIKIDYLNWLMKLTSLIYKYSMEKSNCFLNNILRNIICIECVSLDLIELTDRWFYDVYWKVMEGSSCCW